MSDQFVMYEAAVKISRARHGGASIAPIENYNFSRNVNATPLTAIEFRNAASEYPIVFLEEKSVVTPAAVLGLRDGENMYLSSDGQWNAKFIPAFVRRYPFAFSQTGDLLEMCIDANFPGLNNEGQGSRLFTDEGTPTPYVDRVMEFLKEYQAHFVRSQQFGARLQSLGLLEQMQARATIAPGKAISLRGFLAVNREKLKALPDETLADLARTDELEMIYLHLHSLAQFERLRDRMVAEDGAQSEGAAPQPADAS